jgi:hypothetical protein
VEYMFFVLFLIVAAPRRANLSGYRMEKKMHKSLGSNRAIHDFRIRSYCGNIFTWPKKKNVYGGISVHTHTCLHKLP